MFQQQANVHRGSHHGSHPPVDQALLQRVAGLLLPNHLGLLRRPPPVSGAALLQQTQASVTDGANTLSYKWTANPCIRRLPCLRSLHQNQSYHSCHQMKRRRSPWARAWSCGSSSDPFWSMEFGPPVSGERQRQRSGHLWRYIITSYICTVENNTLHF